MDVSRRRFLSARRSADSPLRPPWSLGEEAFVASCTRCDDCVSACPTGVLQRGEGGYPVVDFMQASCTLCGDCAAACADGALVRRADIPSWRHTLTIVASCLPLQHVECRVCGEACEEEAIVFRPRLGSVAQPEFDSQRCTACGACISPCPVGALRTIPLPVHQQTPSRFYAETP